jgi:hypothetical protein
MKPSAFCYWFQGYLEVSKATSLTSQQMKMVKRHLALVFNAARRSRAKRRGWSGKEIEYCEPRRYDPNRRICNSTVSKP